MANPYPEQPYTNINQPKDSSLAIISMICGIAAYVIVPVVGGIVAVILGHMAKNEIKKSNGLIKGNGMATAGLILGYIHLGLVVLSACAFLVILPAMGASIADVFSNINSSLY